MTIYHQESQISLIFRPSISSASWTAVVMIIGRFFYLFILQLCCPNGISLMENSGCLHRGKPAATESRYPTYGTCWVFLCFHNPPNSDEDYRVLNLTCAQMLMHVSAHRGVWPQVKESVLKIDSGTKIPCHTRESNLHQWRDGLMLHQ